MLFIFIVFSGLISIAKTEMDIFPEQTERFLEITTRYNGLDPENIETAITVPLEESLKSLKNIKNLSSVSRRNLSSILIEFNYGADIGLSLLEAKQCIERLTGTLPLGSEKPQIRIKSINDSLLFRLAVVPENNHSFQNDSNIEKEITEYFHEIEGIAGIEISGKEDSEIIIHPDLKLLASHGLSINDIKLSVDNTNFLQTSGFISENGNEIMLVSRNPVQSVNDLYEMHILSKNKNIIKLKDIADIKFTSDPSSDFSFYDSSPCLTVNLFKKHKTNPLLISGKIKKTVQNINNKNDSRYKICIIKDSAEDLMKNIFLLLLSLILGLLISFFVLYFHFRSFIISILILAVIPFSILFIILVLNIFSQSLNIYSSGGITISLGMIIDSSTVVCQSIINELSRKESNRCSFDKIVYASVCKVHRSNSGSTVTTSIVFLPLLFKSGPAGELFYGLTISIISGLIFSLIYSISILPSISVLFLEKTFRSSEPAEYKKTKSFYKKHLELIFHHKFLHIKMLIALSGVFIIFISFIKKEPQEETYTPEIFFSIDYGPDSSTNRIKKEALDLSDFIKTNMEPEIIYFTSSIKDFSDSEYSSNSVNFFIRSRNRKNKNQLISMLNEIENLSFKKNTNFTGSTISGNRTHILQGPSRKELTRILKSKGISFSPDRTKVSRKIHINEYQKSRFHISNRMLSDIIYSYTEGLECTPLIQGQKETKIKIVPEAKLNPEAILDYPFLTDYGFIKLSSLITLSTEKTEEILYRFNGKPSVLVNSSGFTAENGMNIINLPEKQKADLVKELGLLSFISIVLLYCITGAMYGSFTRPLIIFQGILPAVSGALLILFISFQSLNINSGIALIVLAGSSVNVPIYLIENLKSFSKKEIIESSVSKLPALIVTTLTSSLTLIPFSIDLLHINPQSSLSSALFSGLLFSFLIMIFMTPYTLYVKFGAKNA